MVLSSLQHEPFTLPLNPPPPPVLYNTKIHIMPARIILDICKPGCFVSDLLTEIKNNGEVINTFLDNEILTDQNSLTHLLDFDEESDNSINSIELSLYYTMTNFINKIDTDTCTIMSDIFSYKMPDIHTPLRKVKKLFYNVCLLFVS